METKEKQKDFIAIDVGTDRKRFSDCCNAEILNRQCPKCGRFMDDTAGRREVELKGMDGKRVHTDASNVLVSMVDDTPPKKDKMPGLYKDMQERGIKILSWSDSSI